MSNLVQVAGTTNGNSGRHPLQQIRIYVGFEVFMAVTMKNAVFWDVAPYGFIIN
jgi:hypothetical protein